MPQQTITDEEINKCFEVMSELRENLVKDEFLDLVRQMEREGYRLAFHQENGSVVVVAGYRVFTNLNYSWNL